MKEKKIMKNDSIKISANNEMSVMSIINESI